MIIALLIVVILLLCVQIAQTHLLMRKIDDQAIKVTIPARHKERFPDSEDHKMVGKSQNPLLI